MAQLAPLGFPGHSFQAEEVSEPSTSGKDVTATLMKGGEGYIYHKVRLPEE